MRRLGIIIFTFLLLSGCRRAGPLAPEEVLRKTIAASAQLESVQFDAAFDVRLHAGPMRLNGVLSLTGVLAQGGEQSALTAELRGTSEREGSATALQGTAEFVSDPQDFYVLLHALQAEPLLPQLRGIQAVLGSWWKIPREGSKAKAPLTPDPQFLRSQAAVVAVMEDRGLETINGRDAYRYDVVIDPERLLTLLRTSAEQSGKPLNAQAVRAELELYDVAGELWIDAESFVVHRLAWNIRSKDEPLSLHLHLRADLSKHNTAAPITVPKDARELQREQLIERLLNLPAGSDSFSP